MVAFVPGTFERKSNVQWLGESSFQMQTWVLSRLGQGVIFSLKRKWFLNLSLFVLMFVWIPRAASQPGRLASEQGA